VSEAPECSSADRGLHCHFPYLLTRSSDLASSVRPKSSIRHPDIAYDEIGELSRSFSLAMRNASN
jgi:hypothetical protein